MNRILPVFLVFAAGCEELDPYIPDVRFDSMRVDDIDFEHADVQFVFAVDNPDPVEIQLTQFDYNLGLEDVNLLSGQDDDGMTLQAIGSSEVALPVSLIWQDVWDTVQATRGEDYVGFGLDGTFGFDTPIGEAILPYDADGEFPAVRTPKFSFKKLRVERLNTDLTADLGIDLDVDNDHGSSIDFQDFDFDIKLGGQHVGDGLIPELGTVDGATTGTLTIPLSIDLLSVGDQVWDAINGNGNLNIGLAATTNVETPFGLLPLSVDEDGNITVESN